MASRPDLRRHSWLAAGRMSSCQMYESGEPSVGFTMTGDSHMSDRPELRIDPTSNISTGAIANMSGAYSVEASSQGHPQETVPVYSRPALSHCGPSQRASTIAASRPLAGMANGLRCRPRV